MGILVKNQNKIANDVYPDETAHYEPSNLDLHNIDICTGL